MEQGDYFQALVWTSETLRQEAQFLTDEPALFKPSASDSTTLRLRAAALFQQSPRLVRSFGAWEENPESGNRGPHMDRILFSRCGRFVLAMRRSSVVGRLLPRPSFFKSTSRSASCELVTDSKT